MQHWSQFVLGHTTDLTLLEHLSSLTTLSCSLLGNLLPSAAPDRHARFANLLCAGRTLCDLWPRYDCVNISSSQHERPEGTAIAEFLLPYQIMSTTHRQFAGHAKKRSVKVVALTCPVEMAFESPNTS
eukprot:823042-Amphidinium_carterae.1